MQCDPADILRLRTYPFEKTLPSGSVEQIKQGQEDTRHKKVSYVQLEIDAADISPIEVDESADHEKDGQTKNALAYFKQSV